MRIEDISRTNLTVSSPEIGDKSIFGIIPPSGSWNEPLVGLHEPAWWVAIKLNAQGTDRFSVEIRNAAGRPAFGPELSHWTHFAGSLIMLPFPIPAAMATKMGLQLHISVSEGHGSWVSRKIIFVEMPEETAERYMFVNAAGEFIAHWNTEYEAGGSQHEGFPVEWDKPYRTVLPSSIMNTTTDTDTDNIN
jgi:hypothetical protein